MIVRNHHHAAGRNVILSLFTQLTLLQMVSIIIVLSIALRQPYLLHVLSILFVRQLNRLWQLWYRYHIELPENQLPMQYMRYYIHKVCYESFKIVWGSGNHTSQIQDSWQQHGGLQSADVLQMIGFLRVIHDVRHVSGSGYFYLWYICQYRTRLSEQHYQYNSYQQYEQILSIQEYILHYQLFSTSYGLNVVFPLPKMKNVTRNKSARTATSKTLSSLKSWR